MPKEAAAPEPKRIVYLWGAGATQAEISYLGANRINLLMRDTEALGEGVATRIIGKLQKKFQSAFFSDKGLDIEKLISLLGGCSVEAYSQLATTIRKHYFEDIRDNLALAKVLANPRLAIGLLTLHNDAAFGKIEELTGIISTNHDGLLQLAMQVVHSEVDIGFAYVSEDLSPGTKGSPQILQLHGSFTWQFGLPIRVSPLTEKSEYLEDTVWIPPTIAKESKAYPFNRLSAQAYEVLARRCDVLRVVGSALTQNDWNVLSMIFNAQRHNELTEGRPFRIELVMSHSDGVRIEEECSFLKNLTPIGHITDGDLAAYKDDPSTYTEEMWNPLFYWMKQKIKGHLARSELTSTSLHPDVATIAGESDETTS